MEMEITIMLFRFRALFKVFLRTGLLTGVRAYMVLLLKAGYIGLINWRRTWKLQLHTYGEQPNLSTALWDRMENRMNKKMDMTWKLGLVR